MILSGLNCKDIWRSSKVRHDVSRHIYVRLWQMGVQEIAGYLCLCFYIYIRGSNRGSPHSSPVLSWQWNQAPPGNSLSEFLELEETAFPREQRHECSICVFFFFYGMLVSELFHIPPSLMNGCCQVRLSEGLIQSSVQKIQITSWGKATGLLGGSGRWFEGLAKSASLHYITTSLWPLTSQIASHLPTLPKIMHHGETGGKAPWGRELV